MIRINIIHIVFIDELILYRFDIEIALLIIIVVKFLLNKLSFFQLFYKFNYDNKNNKSLKYLFQLNIYVFKNEN